LSFLVDFQIERPAGEEARVTVDETKVNVGTLRRCKVGDGMDLEEESAVLDESDLSWVELVAIQYFVHQVEVPKPSGLTKSFTQPLQSSTNPIMKIWSWSVRSGLKK
jgi:hypothetical protein